MDHFPYSTPERRALSSKERSLLRFLLLRIAPDRADEVDELEVFARCGCGECPTVMFHAAPEERKATARVIADYWGEVKGSGLVGIMLWERDGEISELEAWSVNGMDVQDWPSLDTLRPLALTA